MSQYKIIGETSLFLCLALRSGRPKVRVENPKVSKTKKHFGEHPEADKSATAIAYGKSCNPIFNGHQQEVLVV